jgi:hypothetical protein
LTCLNIESVSDQDDEAAETVALGRGAEGAANVLAALFHGKSLLMTNALNYIAPSDLCFCFLSLSLSLSLSLFLFLSLSLTLSLSLRLPLSLSLSIPPSLSLSDSLSLSLSHSPVASLRRQTG